MARVHTQDTVADGPKDTSKGSLEDTAIYLPEIHDLAPHMAPRLDALLDLLPDAAREHVAWLAVPNWQDAEPLDAVPDFARRLRALAGTPVLHGWTHSLGPSFGNWLLYGHDNRSEFAPLGRAETERRIAQGRELSARAIGRSPTWFCAPRWQGNAHLDAVLRAQGFEGVMTRDGLTHFTLGARAVPALNFDEGARAVVNGVALLRRSGAIRRLLASRVPFRLALHPDDLTRPAVLRQIRHVIGRLEAEGWRPAGLDDIVGRAMGEAI
ncbi:MAG: DUF2334 domain-containing protein [Pseudomonadota bacterium]